MAGRTKWRLSVAIALFAEIFTLAYMFGLPALHGKVRSFPHFPNLIVYTHNPPSCTYHFQANFFAAAAGSTLFWICIVLASAGMIRLIRNTATER